MREPGAGLGDPAAGAESRTEAVLPVSARELFLVGLVFFSSSFLFFSCIYTSAKSCSLLAQLRLVCWERGTPTSC